MKKSLLLTLMISLFAVSAWAADVSYTEKFSKVGNLNNNTSDVYGDLCTWHRTLASHRAQDTILVKTRRAFLLPVAYAGKGKLETTDWEGGIKSVEFKFGRFGSENTAGRVLQLNVKAGTIENPTATYAKNAMKLSTGTTPQGNETYSYEFNCKEQDAQLVIENISTHNETLTSSSSICRILVADIVVTPYILYTQKEATIGTLQHGYVNSEFLDNSGGEALTYSSSDPSIATVDPATGVVTPVSAGDVQIYAALAEGARTHYTLHIVDGIIAENFSKVVQTGSASNATWHGDLFDWTANAVRRGANDTIKGRPIDRQQATWFSKEGYVESSAVVEGGVKNISFLWRQWSAKAASTTTKVAVSYGGEVKAYQEYAEMEANVNESFNEDINGGNANAVLRISNLSYNGTGTVNNRIVIENVKITPWLLYTTKEATLDTRVNLTYTNTGLINNTTGDAPTYEIAPANAAVSINAEGQVAVEDGADVNADFTVTATWGAVTTTYTLHILSRTATTASYENAKVALNLGADVPANALTKTDGYDGTIGYVSSNTAVATVTSEGVVSLAGGVGQATITATLPQTEKYKAAEAKFDIFVEDPNALTETFSAVPKKNAAGHHNTVWDGDLFDWRVLNAVRKNGDVFPSDAERTGIWMAIPNPDVDLYGIIQSESAVEGGIKYLSFYWEQWGSEAEHILKPAIYSKSGEDPEELKGSMEYMPSGAPIAANRMLFGANDVMRSNSQLILKNESHKSDNSRVAGKGRFIIDEIHITPYLLYTNKAHELYAGESYTNTALINNTGGNDITYSLEDNDGEAEIIDASTGEVRALKAGEVTVKATWNEGGAFTTYTLTILSKVVTEASYPNPIVRLGLGDELPANALGYSEGYDGTIGYASSNPAVATVTSEGVVSLAGGVGQATITATLPVTDNYEAAEASYNLYVRDNTNARIENFSNVETGHGVIGVKDTVWTGTYFDWIPTGAIRHNNSDTIWGSAEANRKIWIATSALSADPAVEAGVLASKEEIEGGIKYLSFYWKQWGSESGRTLRIAAFDGEERKGYMEYVPNGASTQEKFLLGVNDMMRNNHRLYIKNESFKTETFDGTIADDGASSKSRIIIDDIYITPYLLFADKAERVLRIGETDKNTSLINNIGAAASFESSDPAVASIAADGTVTAIARGKVTITAKYEWNENEFVTTTYPVAVYPVNCETFSNEATTSNYASNEETAEGDKATWRARLAGIMAGDFEANVAFIRAPRQNEDKEAYLESSAIAGGIASMSFDWNLVAGETTTNWDIRILINGREVKRLGNDDLTTAKMENFAQISIPAINEPDNFVIRFENHSTINGTYTTGNKARFVIDNICWESYNGTKTLAEDDATNESWIRANGGQTRTVEISRSALVGGVWNTLCLPFAISKSSDLDDAEVVEMTNVEQNGDEIDITFTAISGDELAGGMPYLVRPASNKNISGTYSDKQIVSVLSSVNEDMVSFIGLYGPLAVTANDYNTLFVGTPDGEGNNLFYPQADGQLRGLRAYFKIITATPMTAPLRRARYVINQTEVVTDIESIQNSEIRIQKVIRDGQLYIMYNGVMYNVQGARVQ